MSLSLRNPTTARLLGLGVAAGYAGLGLFQAVRPVRASQGFYDIPKHVVSAQVDSQEQVGILVKLLAARDLSVAAALLGLAYGGRTREMGTVILAATILCAADTAAVWTRRGAKAGLLMATGATIWTLIGLGLQLS